MARLIPVTFDMYFQTNFSTSIRGHHLYKGSWKPEIGEDLDCCRYEREEAYLHDNHAQYVNARLMHNFLKASEENRISVTVNEKGKLA